MILIFSRPIRTGKTTELLRTFAGRKDVGGFLTPDVAGRRMLYDLANDTYGDFEALDNDPAPVQLIGRFRFLETAFTHAKTLLQNEKPWVVVDEIGRLEIDLDRGLEPDLQALVAAYAAGAKVGILLLVVRDSLLEKAIQKYKLGDVRVISDLTVL